MSSNKYQRIFFIIATAIVATIGVQLYWNYLNYKENKQRVSNEILASLDAAVESYYATLSKRSFFNIVTKPSQSGGIFFKNDTAINNKMVKSGVNITSLKIETNDPDEYETLPRLIDSIFVLDTLTKKSLSQVKLNAEHSDRDIKIFNGYQNIDTVNILKGLQRVMIAYTNDDIDFVKLDSIFKKELSKKNIGADYYFNYYVADSLQTSTKLTTQDDFQNRLEAKSTYLRRKQSLQLFHDATTFDALKKSFTGILISFFLAVIIISSLFYLLRIIKDQKELAAIKNDLISNITHEFKTPIATVSTAIEAIANFNVIDDKEKTKKYLNLSSVQLNKLHQMVEKLLETATLDSEKLLLKKEQVDATELIQKLTEKYKLLATDKNLQFSFNVKPIYLDVDAFHFENVLSNLIDNAIKYGGDQIDININAILGNTEIGIADNGSGIEKSQQEKIFDKFYRVPKGNTHNVKGFGIGLYYCKKIIEKHEGSLDMSSEKGKTIFKISLPNV